MMKKLLGVLFFYIITVVLLLPLLVTVLLGGYDRNLPREAKVSYDASLPAEQREIFEKTE